MVRFQDFRSSQLFFFHSNHFISLFSLGSYLNGREDSVHEYPRGTLLRVSHGCQGRAYLFAVHVVASSFSLWLQYILLWCCQCSLHPLLSRFILLENKFRQIVITNMMKGPLLLTLPIVVLSFANFTAVTPFPENLPRVELCLE